MVNQNSGRKNQSPKQGGHSPQGGHGRGQGPASRPRTVSPNYQVDMFHHQVGSSSQQQSGSHGGYGRYGSGSGGQSQPGGQGQPGGRSGRPSPGGPPRSSAPRHKPRPVRPLSGGSSKAPAARKGYSNHTFELKNDLYKQFSEKLKVADKSPKEVINQLISFYNMDKIKI